uniref:MADF domain-containing protein n=1 Tax=Caenorhabditis tropicalis TaxID=1561998 RepID=A0A1I7UGW1_9PELO
MTPLWRLPPLRPLPTLPEPSATRNFPVDRYWEVAKDTEYPFDDLDENNSVVLRQVVLDEIRQRPPIWCSRSSACIRDNYPDVAVMTFKRTVASINRIYKGAKDALRNRLRVAIVKKRLTPVQVEEVMWNWELYPFIRHYREFTQHWEAELQIEISLIDENLDSEKPAKRSRHSPDDWHDEPLFTLSTNEQLQLDSQKWAELEPSTSFIVKAEPKSDPEAPPPVDFSTEMEQITYQANRIAREQPERIRILRKVLFDVVLAFDQKEYGSAKEIYQDLYEKN